LFLVTRKSALNKNLVFHIRTGVFGRNIKRKLNTKDNYVHFGREMSDSRALVLTKMYFLGR
jgi:hypothetical protein